MDAYNIDSTVAINVTETIEIATELAANVTGVPSILTLQADIF